MGDSESLNFDVDLSELNTKLVFSRFTELAKQKDILYSDFIEIDEPNEIGKTWVEFSGEVVKDLLEVINLTKSLFERLVDELRRSQEEPSQDELDRIKNLTSFWLDLSVIAYLYATIEKRGVLEQDGKNQYSMGYVDSKKSLDELTLLAFQAGKEFFKLESRITLGEALSLNMEKKRLDFIDDIGNGSELRFQILGEYDKNQALFLLTRVFTRLLEGADSWWFLDAIALNSATEHAIDHIISMKTNWYKCTSDLITKADNFYGYQQPIALLSSKVALAQHYRRLAMAALESRANNIAAEYFGQAAALTSAVDLAIMNKVDNYNIWDKNIPEQYLIYSQMSHLATISHQYESVLEYMENGEREKASEMIPKILEKLSNMLSEGDIAYVSSVALAYETVFAYINEQIGQNTATEKIIAFVENRISTVGSRLHKASHQMVKNWIEVVKSNVDDVEILQDLISNVDYPLMAIYILPPGFGMVSSSSKELQAVQLATEALSISHQAELEFGKNPVKEMLMRAKTFDMTQHALTLIKEVQDDDTIDAVRNLLKPVAKNAFLRGLIAEIQLRTAVLQYRYINRVAPLIENSSLSQGKEKKTAQHDQEELISFINSVEELYYAANEVNKHQSPIHVGGSPLNWDYIQKLEYFSNGLVLVLKAILNAIEATGQDKNAHEDAITNWDQAKSLSFEAADLISNANTQESDTLSQQVYTLAQIFYEFENSRRDRKASREFPVDGILELVSTLLMGL